MSLLYKCNALPKYREIYIKKEAKILVWKITEDEDTLSILLNSEEANKYLSTYKSEKSRKQFLATRLLLKEVGLPLFLNKDENGKPHLDDGFISISHDSQYVSLMLSESHICGIDLQSESEKVIRIKHKFVDVDDKLYGNGQLRDLTLLWSVKEAVYKIYGDPLLYFKEHIRIKGYNRDEVFVEILHPDYRRKVTLKVKRMDDLILVYTI